jgi:HSP20 family protein
MENWNWTKNDGQNTSRNTASAMQNMSNLPAASYFGPLSSFYQEMDRMFNQAFRNFGLPSVFGSNTALFNPSVDISSTDKEYTIEVEAPGLKEEDVRIDLTRDGELCICGEKRQENEKQEKDFHRVERVYGTFSRTLSLPQDADLDNIEADFNNGVLTITIPRLESQDSKARRIEVGSSERGNHRRRRETSHQDNTAHSNPKRAA